MFTLLHTQTNSHQTILRFTLTMLPLCHLVISHDIPPNVGLSLYLSHTGPHCFTQYTSHARTITNVVQQSPVTNCPLARWPTGQWPELFRTVPGRPLALAFQRWIICGYIIIQRRWKLPDSGWALRKAGGHWPSESPSRWLVCYMPFSYNSFKVSSKR